VSTKNIVLLVAVGGVIYWLLKSRGVASPPGGNQLPAPVPEFPTLKTQNAPGSPLAAPNVTPIRRYRTNENR
jgi:hypothetical protein